MKKWMRTLLCSLGVALMLGGTAFAADAIEVQVNDVPITFTDVQPVAKDGRTYIPMRATFNALGFADEDIAWDGAVGTVTAVRDDLIISLKLGEKKITITEAGETRVVETDAAAYAANNRTFVPVRFVAEAAGCNVGWDSVDRIVLIDDVDALLAANAETYSLMDQYMDYSRQYSEGNVAMQGELGMSMAVADGLSLGMGGEFKAISNMTAVEMEMDLDMLVEMMYPDENGELTAMQESQALSLEACGDMETGVLYFKSDELTTMMGMEGDVWFKMDMNAMMSMEGMDELVGMDYAELMELSKNSVDMTFEESIAAVLKMIPLTDDEMTAGEMLALIDSICADSAFVKDGSDFISAVEIEDCYLDFVLHSKGGKINGCSVGVAVDGQEILMMTMQDDELVMVMQFIDDENGVGLEMTLGAAYSKTSKVPMVEPPENVAVIDLLALVEIDTEEVVEATEIMIEPDA